MNSDDDIVGNIYKDIGPIAQFGRALAWHARGHEFDPRWVHFNMQSYRQVLIIGVIEVFIGGFTFVNNILTFLLGINPKSPKVLLFVLIASFVSFFIGVGLLKFKKIAYQLLLYFSSVIILSKILIFLGVMELNGALETTIPAGIKRLISFGYHSWVLIYFSKPKIRAIFHK